MSILTNPKIAWMPIFLCTQTPLFNIYKTYAQGKTTEEKGLYNTNLIINIVVMLIFLGVLLNVYLKYIFVDDNKNKFCEGLIACLSPVLYLAFKQAGKSV